MKWSSFCKKQKKTFLVPYHNLIFELKKKTFFCLYGIYYFLIRWGQAKISSSTFFCKKSSSQTIRPSMQCSINGSPKCYHFPFNYDILRSKRVSQDLPELVGWLKIVLLSIIKP